MTAHRHAPVRNDVGAGEALSETIKGGFERDDHRQWRVPVRDRDGAGPAREGILYGHSWL